MAETKRAVSSWGQRLVVLAPYLWLAATFLLPFLIVLKISLSQVQDDAIPPYQPVLDFAAGWQGVVDFLHGLSLANYRVLAEDDLYLWTLRNSLEIAAVSTAILVLVGYPLAYGMTRAPKRLQTVLIVLVILPFWTSSVVRVYAWENILRKEGPLNELLLWLGAIKDAVIWYPGAGATYLGFVYTYLPFMVLPIYAALQRMDETLFEAAADLGCPRWKMFWVITLPLSMPGVVAGALLCAIPIVGEYVIPDRLGTSDMLMVGQELWNLFLSTTPPDWPLASALAVILLAALLVPIVIYERLEAAGRQQGG